MKRGDVQLKEVLECTKVADKEGYETSMAETEK